MAIVENITANCDNGTLSRSLISRQWDDKGTLIQFAGYPEPEDAEQLIYRLIVWMKSTEDGDPAEQAPIELEADQWLISNVYTQFPQTIRFQLCITNEAGTYEKHSPIFSGNIGRSLSHSGEETDIDVSTLFDPYKKYVDELIIGAGATVIDADLDTAGAAADAKAVGDELTELNERLGQLGSGVSTEVRTALYTLLSNVAFDDNATYTDELAVIQSWATECTAVTLSASTASISGSSTVTLTATTTPAGGTVTWTSSNTAVATVSSAGVVTGVSNGSATITATCGDVSATCTVTVSGFATLTSITATYTQSGAVYDTDTLDSLKANLVVTANYDNSTTEVISDYTLSGTLTEGTSTITASYGGFTDTFNVTVTSETTILPITWNGTGAELNTDMIDARNVDVYFSLPFVEGDSNLVSGATSESVPAKIRVNVYESADSTSAYAFYYIDTEAVETTRRTWANTPDLPWNTELKIIPAGHYIKVQVNKPSGAPFSSNSTYKAYFTAHGNTLKLRATWGA